jgi:small-conductance mechanosensitive channel
MEKILSQYLSAVYEKPILEVAHASISFSTLIYIAIIIIIANLVYLGLKLFVSIQIKRNKIRNAQAKSLLQLFLYLLFIITFLFILNALGYSLSYLFVGSTALLVGLGFGLQQLFVDVISGVILLIDKNINLGDVVRLDTLSNKENMLGRIHHIGLRATLLQTIDNEFMIVPNSKFLTSGISSLMKDKGAVRFRIKVLVEYNEDMTLVRKVITEALFKNINVEKAPEPTIIAKDFADSGVLLEVRFWMKEIFTFENIVSDIRYQILEDFRTNNITIPFPHLKINRS